MRGFILGLMAATMLAGPVMADDRRDRRDDRRDDRREWRDDRRDDRRDFRRDVRNDRRDDRRDFRRDNRRDWYQDQRYWRQNGRDDYRWAGPRHRGPAFVYPRGVRYQPYAIGYRMPPQFIGRPYWVDNPRYYRLPPAYRGTRWVRYGPDALLIQIGNGVVIQAIRGVWF